MPGMLSRAQIVKEAEMRRGKGSAKEKLSSISVKCPQTNPIFEIPFWDQKLGHLQPSIIKSHPCFSLLNSLNTILAETFVRACVRAGLKL